MSKVAESGFELKCGWLRGLGSFLFVLLVQGRREERWSQGEHETNSARPPRAQARPGVSHPHMVLLFLLKTQTCLPHSKPLTCFDIPISQSKWKQQKHPSKVERGFLGHGM